jgi:polysaccharide export outer membrane protein
MTLQILHAKRITKTGRFLLVMHLMSCGGYLAGCGAPFDKEGEGALVERQEGAWKPASASPSSERDATPTRETSISKTPPSRDGAPVMRGGGDNAHQLAEVADRYMATNTPGNGAYKVGPQDVIEISVFKVPELSKRVQVASAGTVNLPLVGEVPASGKTARELERDLTAQLGDKYLRNPQVTVYVREYNSQRVTIEGAIKSPGVYPLKGRTTLLQLVATAGSLDKETASSELVVFRSINGRKHAAKYDFDDIRSGHAPDPVLQEGDIIIVDTSTSKTMLGGVLKMLPLTSFFIPLI